jgi:HAE1 family hydrophobic/amphiphilic exporter-1
MTTLIMASLIVFGLLGYRLLAVAALPAVDFPTIQITATLPGASAETMGTSVAGPIERALSTIAGVTSLTSTSALGTSSIVLQFDLTRDIDGAALDVQTALTVAARKLPIEMVTPPSFRKVNPADQAVIQLSLTSPTLPMSKVDDYGETLAQQISQLPGVAQVLVQGEQKFAVRVQVDPIAAAQRDISMEDVRTVLSKNNSNTPVGSISGIEAKQNTTLDASAAMRTAAEYKNVVAAYRNGAPIKLSEIANVVDDVENQLGANYYKNQKSIGLSIYKQADGNTVKIADAVYEQLPRFRAQVPPSVKMELFADRSVSVRNSVRDVQVTLGVAVVLVVAVIFLFLRSGTATIIPSLAVPISLIASCAAMYLFNFSINNLTLMALTLSVGFVVDDAIVMLENIVRHIEGGMTPFEAALKGSREVRFTIISITFSLIAVFIPVLLMGGIVGRVFREFAVTITVIILISGFVSLTLTPMLCARVLKSRDEGENQNIVLRAFEDMFKRLLRSYEATLDVVLKYRFATLLVMIGTLIGTVWLYIGIPKDFFPIEDTGFLNVVAEGPSDTSFTAMTARTREIADIMLKDPAVDYLNITTGVGGGANATSNFGRALVVLKPRNQREDIGRVVQRLRVKTNVLAGVATYFQVMQNLNIGGRNGKSMYQYTLQSSDIAALYKVGPEMVEKIAKIPGLRDVTSDLYVNNPQMSLQIDREAAAVYGVTQDQIRQELYDCFGSRPVATMYTEINDYYVILECDPKIQANTVGLSNLFLKTNLNGQATADSAAPAAGSGVSGATAPTGPVVPLSALVRQVPTIGALQVNHQSQQPATTISFSTDPGYALGQAVDAIRDVEQQEHLPDSITSSFQGSAQVFEDSLKGEGFLVLGAVFAAFVVLGILYESFVHPITILSGLPSAGVGALIVLMMFRMDLSVIALIGIVMLVGIVKKNAIMMIDFALQRRAVGVTADAAIREACLMRFRPIMMTTCAAIFGALPIAIGAGAGSELRQPLGVAVVGGLLVSQLLTLYITPVVYLYLDKIDRPLKRRLNPSAGLDDERKRQMPKALAAE